LRRRRVADEHVLSARKKETSNMKLSNKTILGKLPGEGDYFLIE